MVLLPGCLDICNQVAQQFFISPNKHSVWLGHFQVDVVSYRVVIPLILEHFVDALLVQLKRIRISILYQFSV